MKNAKTNWAISRGLIAIALVAVIGFSFVACDNGNMEDDKINIDTSALDAVLLEAGNARGGVIKADDASEVPEGRFWVTGDEWDAFDAVYKKAAETKANPSSQAAVDTARANLQAAIVTFNAAKKEGSGAAITLSGTITVKNKGKLVPYVSIQPHTDGWGWNEYNIRVPLTGEDTPWSIIITPFSGPTEIFFEIAGYNDDKFEKQIFVTDFNDPTTVYNTDVDNIAINMDLNLITISGTFNLDYNGKTIPSVDIQASLKNGGKIGSAVILNAGKNNSWSMMIPSQTEEADVIFMVVGFDGPAWGAGVDQLFFLWGVDPGVRVKDKNIPNIAINLITISGTINVTYNGSPVPLIWLHFDKKVDDNDLEWIRGEALYSPSSGSLWSILIPAYTSDTEIEIGVSGGQNEAWDGELFPWRHGATITVKNTNVTGITLDLGDITDVGGIPNIDTTALNTVILEAGLARDGVIAAENASEVPTGRKWATQSEWDAFDAVYKAAAETKANPASQAAVDTAKTNLQTALNTFNAAKKDGSGAAIKLSGTITIKNNGQIVPYVSIDAHNEDWSWSESKRVHITGENTPWEIITKQLSSPKDIYFRITGFDNDKYENYILVISIDNLMKTVSNSDISDININENLNLITISGTLNLDYNGKLIPSVSLSIDKPGGGTLGSVNLLQVRNNTPWSMMIPAQTVDTDVVFNIVGFAGPLAWEYDRSFEIWGIDFGVKIGNQDKTGIAINLITISGTVNVTYNGSRIPIVEIPINASDWSWITNTTLKSPSANTPWSVVLPAYTSDTEIRIGIVGKDENETELFARYGEITKTVKNTNVSDIVLNLGDITDD